MANKDYDSRETSGSRNSDSTGSFVLGVLLGGLAGAAAAFLLSPKSGKEIRSTLNTQAGTLKEKTVQIRDTVLNKAKTANENPEESPINYISLNDVPAKANPKPEKPLDETDIRKKLEEAKKAFEEEEYKVTQ
nr:YtxH domain-containing protein [Neobacillus sp. Marseille-Q6967]